MIDNCRRRSIEEEQSQRKKSDVPVAMIASCILFTQMALRKYSGELSGELSGHHGITGPSIQGVLQLRVSMSVWPKCLDEFVCCNRNKIRINDDKTNTSSVERICRQSSELWTSERPTILYPVFSNFNAFGSMRIVYY